MGGTVPVIPAANEEKMGKMKVEQGEGEAMLMQPPHCLQLAALSEETGGVAAVEENTLLHNL
jgi:hypothetical protein